MYIPLYLLAFTFVQLPFEVLFRALDLQNVVSLWNAALLEYPPLPLLNNSFIVTMFKIVLHSKHAALAAIVCECITALLYPFRWFHIYIYLLYIHGSSIHF